MNKLLIATKNGHKLDEFKEIFGKEYNVYSLFDFPDIPEIEETGHTFEENSQLKATTLFKYVKETTIADDSGLVVSSLDGAPEYILPDIQVQMQMIAATEDYCLKTW